MKETELLRFVTFRRADTTFGVDVARVRRVMRPGAMERMSSAPDYVCGKVRIEDRVEIIVDPARLLGRANAVTDDASRVVLVSHGSHDFGLLSDGIDGVTEIGLADVQPPPPFLEDPRGVVRGLVVSGDQEILVLDLAPLLKPSAAGPEESSAD